MPAARSGQSRVESEEDVQVASHAGKVKARQRFNLIAQRLSHLVDLDFFSGRCERKCSELSPLLSPLTAPSAAAAIARSDALVMGCRRERRKHATSPKISNIAS